MRKTLFVSWCLLLSTLASAQTVRVGGGLSAKNSLGYQAPGFVVSVDPELMRRNFLLTGSAWLNSENKYIGDGYSFGANASLLYRCGQFLIGPGVNYSKTITSQWEKSSVRPMVSVGVEHREFRFLGSYILPGTDADNHLQGVNATLWAFHRKRVSFRMTYSVYHFHVTGQPDKGRVAPAISGQILFTLWSKP
jgi:hypothetical protein